MIVENDRVTIDTVYDPHREKIGTILVTAVLEHIEARRMQHMSFTVAVLAAALGAIALFKYTREAEGVDNHHCVKYGPGLCSTNPC